jgi:hypothetical protein
MAFWSFLDSLAYSYQFMVGAITPAFKLKTKKRKKVNNSVSFFCLCLKRGWPVAVSPALLPTMLPLAALVPTIETKTGRTSTGKNGSIYVLVRG